jgi:hypothetical protein
MAATTALLPPRRFPIHLAPGGTYCFMSSHRGSIAINVEGGLELYRASKVALNMLARGLWAPNRERGLTVLSIHPGWVNTKMGTLDGAVAAEMELAPSVRGVADVVERHMGSGENRYLDWGPSQHWGWSGRDRCLRGVDRWLDEISVRSRSRACHCKRRSPPGAADRRRVVTSASTVISPSDGSVVQGSEVRAQRPQSPFGIRRRGHSSGVPAPACG